MASQPEFLNELAHVYQGDEESFPWFCYAALVYQVNDEMQAVGDVWAAAVGELKDEQKKLQVTRKLRESLLKASVLVGFPKVESLPASLMMSPLSDRDSQGINALTTLRNRVREGSPDIQQQLDQDKSLRQSLQRDERDRRGKEFFQKIYAQHTDRVLQNMSVASGGDLAEFAINAVYGDLMASTEVLNAKHTGLLEFLACYATGGTTTLQAKSHMYGAHNLGNTKAEIRAATTICDKIEAKIGRPKDRNSDAWKWLAKADAW